MSTVVVLCTVRCDVSSPVPWGYESAIESLITRHDTSCVVSLSAFSYTDVRWAWVAYPFREGRRRDWVEMGTVGWARLFSYRFSYLEYQWTHSICYRLGGLLCWCSRFSSVFLLTIIGLGRLQVYSTGVTICSDVPVGVAWGLVRFLTASRTWKICSRVPRLQGPLSDRAIRDRARGEVRVL